MRNKNHHYHKGDRETWYSDGSGYVSRADGGRESWYSDGSGYVTRGDGTRETWYSDGSGYVHFPDGGRKVKYSDGSGYSNYSDGRRKVWNSDGSGYVDYPNGKRKYWDSSSNDHYDSTPDLSGIGGSIASWLTMRVVSHVVNRVIDSNFSDYDHSDYMPSSHSKIHIHSNPVPIYYDDAKSKEEQAERHRQQLRELELQRQQEAIRKARRKAAWKKFWNVVLRKKLEIPLSSDECKGKQYEDVVNAFTNAGFVRILTKPVDDLRADNNLLKGRVVSVSVKKSTEFDASNRYRITSPIIVSYHDVHKSRVPIASREVKKNDIDYVVSSFKTAGFLNVEAIPLNDLKPKKNKRNGKVVSVSINGSKKYSRRKKLRIDSNIQIKYHSIKTT